MFPHAAMMLAGGVVQLLAWNPADKDSTITLSNNNKTMAETGAGSAAPGVRTPALASGKVYAEARADFVKASGDVSIGIGNSSSQIAAGTSSFVGYDANAVGYVSNGNICNNLSTLTTVASYTTGDIIGVAYSSSALKVWFSKNGVWQNGDPAAGTGGTACSLGATVMVQAQAPSQTPNDGVTLSTLYAYPPPSGFAAV